MFIFFMVDDDLNICHLDFIPACAVAPRLLESIVLETENLLLDHEHSKSELATLMKAGICEFRKITDTISIPRRWMIDWVADYANDHLSELLETECISRQRLRAAIKIQKAWRGTLNKKKTT